MHDDHRMIAQSWMFAATTDLQVATQIKDTLPPPACFHAQQAVEKALKSALVAVAGDAPRSHLISLLFDELQALDPALGAKLPEHLSQLDQYYLPTRYPDALGGGDAMKTYSVSQANQAVRLAEDVLTSIADHHHFKRAM